MKTMATTKSIIKGRKSDFYIGKKIKDVDGNVVGEVLNASVNKKFKRVYMDIEVDDIYDNPRIDISVDIYKNPKTKRNSLVLTERKLKRKYKRKNK
jgi:hypothetical protein